MGYGVELSVTYASLLIRRVLAHLGRYGIAPEEVVVQTDRGGEFSGQERTRRGFGFVYTVRELCGAEHTYIPPRWPNANADALSPNSWDTQREAVRVCSRRNSAGDFIPSAECGATSL